MSRLVKFFLVGIAALMAVLIGAVAVFTLLPAETYRDWITRAVTSATGRELAITGRFELSFGSTLSLEAGGIRFANADWAGEPQMFTAEKVAAELKLWPLLGGAVDYRLRARAPELILESDASGRGNWELVVGEASSASPARMAEKVNRLFGLLPAELELTDAHLTLVDSGLDSRHEVVLKRFRFGITGGLLGLELTGDVDGKSADLTGDLGAIERIRSGQSTDVRVNGELAGIAWTTTGSWAGFGSGDGPTLDLNLRLVTQSLKVLQPLLRTPIPELGRLELSARLQGGAGQYAANDLNLVLSGKQVQARVQGRVADLLELSGVDLTVSGKVSSLADLSIMAGIELPETPTMEFTAALRATEGSRGPTTVKAQLISELLRIDAQGSVDSLSSIEGINLEILAESKSLTRLGEVVGADLPRLGAMTADFTLITRPGRILGEDIHLLVGRSDLSGGLELTLPGDGRQLAVQGRFKSKLLDLNDLLGIDDYVEERTETNEAIEEGREVSAEPGERMISDEPLSFAALNELDATLQVDADRVDFGNIQINNGRVTLDLKAGDLQLLLSRAKVGDRPVEGRLQLDAGQSPVPVDFRFDADNVSLSDLLGSGAMLQGGRFLLEIAVKGAGNSPRAILGGLHGNVRSVVQDSRMPSSLFARFGRSVLAQINPFAVETGYSEVECAAVDFAIADGMATTPKGLVFQTKEVAWAGTGKIDLNTEKINFNAESKAREGLGLGAGRLAGLALVSGTLTNPTIELDPGGLAREGIWAALAVGSGGLSVVANSLLDRSTADTDLCKQIVRDFHQRPVTVGAGE